MQNMMKSADWPNRLRLMRALTKKQASASLLRTTTQLMKNSIEKEETAKKLAEIVEQEKTEEEIMRELKNL